MVRFTHGKQGVKVNYVYELRALMNGQLLGMSCQEPERLEELKSYGWFVYDIRPSIYGLEDLEQALADGWDCLTGGGVFHDAFCIPAGTSPKTARALIKQYKNTSHNFAIFWRAARPYRENTKHKMTPQGKGFSHGAN